MIIAIIAFILFAALVVAACCKVSGDCSRQEEKDDPCVSCHRWYECNGVDKNCPWRAES